MNRRGFCWMEVHRKRRSGTWKFAGPGGGAGRRLSVQCRFPGNIGIGPAPKARKLLAFLLPFVLVHTELMPCASAMHAKSRSDLATALISGLSTRILGETMVGAARRRQCDFSARDVPSSSTHVTDRPSCPRRGAGCCGSRDPKKGSKPRGPLEAGTRLADSKEGTPSHRLLAETNTRSGSQQRASETSCWSLSMEDSSSASHSRGGRMRSHMRLLKRRLSSDVSEACPRTRRSCFDIVQAPQRHRRPFRKSQRTPTTQAQAWHPEGRCCSRQFAEPPFRLPRTGTISSRSTGGWREKACFLSFSAVRRRAASTGYHTQHL